MEPQSQSGNEFNFLLFSDDPPSFLKSKLTGQGYSKEESAQGWGNEKKERECGRQKAEKLKSVWKMKRSDKEWWIRRRWTQKEGEDDDADDNWWWEKAKMEGRFV